MIGSCIIDGIDLGTLGIFIERGGSDDFLSFPDRRIPDQNDWAEYDGLDVDLTDLSFDAKRVRVNYVIIAADETVFNQRLNSFEALHFAPGSRQIFVREFNRAFSLRFVACHRYQHTGGLANERKKIGKMAADYMMDNPLQLFTQGTNTPVSARNTAHITLNQIDLSRFGIVVQDAYSTALRPRSAKRVLEQRGANGIIADVGVAPKKAARQITVECTMIAETLTEFYTNYNALFNNLRTPVAVRLGITRTGTALNCYYLRMTNFRKLAPFSRKIKVSFNLILQEI